MTLEQSASHPFENLLAANLLELGMEQTGRHDPDQTPMTFGQTEDNGVIHVYAFDKDGNEWGMRKPVDLEEFKQELIELGFTEVAG